MEITEEEKRKFLNSVYVEGYITGKTEKRCPVCNGKVSVEFYGKYKESYQIRCETENCLREIGRGL